MSQKINQEWRRRNPQIDKKFLFKIISKVSMMIFFLNEPGFQYELHGNDYCSQRGKAELNCSLSLSPFAARKKVNKQMKFSAKN